VLDGSLLDFFKKNPFWAIFIIVFTILPIVGAVVHILLKAFGRRGLDTTDQLSLEDDKSDQNTTDDESPDTEKKI
jgi:hypothetical protein